MKVLVIGSGGREHALVWKITQSPKISQIYCAPGNAGISKLAQCVNINADNNIFFMIVLSQYLNNLTIIDLLYLNNKC